MNTIETATNDFKEFQPKYLSICLVLFSATWLISILAAIKTVSFWGITLTGGFIAFPITTTLNSLIVDVYGYKNARQALWCGVIVGFTYLILMNIVNVIPSDPNWGLNKEFITILIPETRLILASIFSFWLSGSINNILMAKLKCRGKSIYFRTIFSLSISLTIDISAYFLLGFLGSVPINILKKIFIFAYLKKIICEIMLLPLVWKLIDWFKKMEQFEIFDFDTDFSPFSFDNVYFLSDYKKYTNTDGDQKLETSS